MSTPNRKCRVLYIQPGTSRFAGIERVVDTICTELVEQRDAEFDVDVLYTTEHKDFPSGARRYNAIKKVARNRRHLLRIFRETVGRGKYDLVVVPQIEPTVICWVACAGLKPRLALHLHGNPALERNHPKAKILFAVMRMVVLRQLRCVFGTSPRQLASFKAMFRSKVPQFWLPNPVRCFESVAKTTGIEGVFTFVNVGRFSYQKGHDVLLDVFRQLYERRSNVRLKLVGHGELEADLRAQIDRLGLSDVVSVEHAPNSPHEALAASDVFVSVSRWEGWSLAICEALRFGLPVVATDCDFGPSDILVDSRLGTLVPLGDQRALLEAMAYYCDNLESANRYSDYRKQYVDRFSAQQVVHVHAKALLQFAWG